MSDKARAPFEAAALFAQRRERTEAQKRYSATIEAAISQAGETRQRVTVEAEDGAEIYAYPHTGGIAWGVNAARSGVNILRGVRRADGTDEAMS
jgi:plasmid stabilization system protein ParE